MSSLTELLIVALWLGLAALLGLSFFVLVTRWRTTLNHQTGELVLRYSPPARVLAGLLGVVALVGLVILVLVMPAPLEVLLAAEAALLAFKLLGWVLVREVFGRHITVSSGGLISRSASGRTQSLAWDEVTQVFHECPARWFVFTNGAGSRIVVPVYMAGLDSLVHAMQANLEAGVYAPAMSGFAFVS